ncbi:MAG: Tol-Pal system beta propeller repeat protein TolB [Proteobacteria bacterium]|nr:Tol-Pal system beta propeller repeat protein TolB [Pseudomonadota bacterium]
MKKAIFIILQIIVFPLISLAQTDIRISGAQTGFPVAIPHLCDLGGAAELSEKLSATINRDLQISGLFKLIDPASFVEQQGKCVSPDKVAYSDWTVIGAEGLVKGEIKSLGDAIEVRLYLHDVQQQKAVIGKKYDSSVQDVTKVAHKFANEIVRYFTGEPGIFGTRLAYVSRVGRFKELFIMDVDGSNNQRLTSDNGLAMSPSWAQNSENLVYTSYRSRRPELYLLSPAGGSPKQLTERQGLEIGAKFLPDGQGIITSATVDGISKIALFDLKGRIVKKLTSGDSIDVSPSVSPDGSRVAFCSNRAGGPQIYVMPISGGSATRISYANSNYCTSPSWSPKGDKVAFVCRAGGNQIFITSPDGGKVSQLTHSGDNEDPSWSPDGRFIAFSSNLGSGTRKIAILSLLGGSPTVVSSGGAEDSQPAWSPKVD